MSEKFNKKEYDIAYQKEKQAQFNVKMRKEEKEKIDSFLKANGITQLKLVRCGYETLKNEIEKGENEMKELLEKYDIESVEDFVPEFYYQNLTNGASINRKAVENLLNQYSKEELIKIENYDELGIVEAVANDRYHIEDNKIIAED